MFLWLKRSVRRKYSRCLSHHWIHISTKAVKSIDSSRPCITFSVPHLISLSTAYPWGSQGCNCFVALSPLFQGVTVVTGYCSQSQLSLWEKVHPGTGAPWYRCTLVQVHPGTGAPWTSRQLIAGPSLVAEAARCQPHIRSNFGVQYLAQGYFDMQLSSAPRELGFKPATPFFQYHVFKMISYLQCILSKVLNL